MKTYAAYFDDTIREKSSSGGIFSVIAEIFDVVYGVEMSSDCYFCQYVRVENKKIESLRGSKYIQAKVGDTFQQVKNDLLDGKSVLFSGTGCQINGLFSFLGKNYENLFLLDVVCHGVPSPKLWREYTNFQELKCGKIESVNFRCKDDSWTDFGMKENQIYISKDNDTFMRMFLRDYCLRPSCYECHAKHYKKADITIADFWGIEYVAPEMNDNKGISAIICRTDKGVKLFDSIKCHIVYQEVSYDDCVKNNKAEYSSTHRPIERDTFFNDLDSLSFAEMEKKYAADVKVSFKRRVKNIIKKIVKKLTGGGTQIKQRSNADYGMLFTFKK